jgi:hypothetical protein
MAKINKTKHVERIDRFATPCPACGEIVFVTFSKKGVSKSTGHSKKCFYYEKKERETNE